MLHKQINNFFMNTANNGFMGLGIAPKFIEVLSKNNYISPTPIQKQSIPIAIKGKDIIGIAQTGTGKTLAFGIPMLQRLAQTSGKGLVIAPTRELALQTDEALQKIGRAFGLKTAVLIGGQSMEIQLQRLRANPHVIIATPGRLIDHLERKTARLHLMTILVLDEADRMLDMGFAPQIKKILEHMPTERQTMLFSATMPKEIVALASHYMKLPVRVEVAPSGSAAKDISQEVFFVDKRDKLHLLENLLSEYRGSILVFMRTKHEARKVTSIVRHMGHTSAELHSNRSLAQRKDALQGFKLGKYRVLIATDIAARGIDVTGIELVINYDLPMNSEDYVHRIGRTGRAGMAGHAISFAMPNQRGDIKGIERVIRMAVPISPLPALNRRKIIIPESPSFTPRSSSQFSGRKSFGRPQGFHGSRNARPSRQFHQKRKPHNPPRFKKRT